MAAPRKPRAKRASRPAPAKPKPIAPNDADPQSWLYLNPNGASESGIVFGVLRKSYGGRTNSAVEFGRRKLQPVAPPGDAEVSPWPVTAERVDIVLPPDAPDTLADPQVLLEAMDQAAIDKPLLAYVTLPFPNTTRLHQAWECARGFARRLAERQLACLLILHAPGRVGSPNPVHAHLLIAPRTIGPLGMEHGTYDHDLVHDSGQAIIEKLWAEHLQASPS